MDTAQGTTSFITKATTFEGPLDLLLSLIESKKLFINEISLSLIAEEYASYVTEMKERQSQTYYEITGYLVILATLLLIKSRSLLPNFDITKEDKVTIDDLEERLKVYKIYKDISKTIAERFDTNIIILKKEQKKEVRFIPDVHITSEYLYGCIQDILTKAPKVETVEQNPEIKVRTTITLEQVMERIQEKVDSLSSFSFNEFTGSKKVYSKEEKVFTLISFLAILELIRTGILVADQENTFGDMNVAKSTITHTL